MLYQNEQVIKYVVISLSEGKENAFDRNMDIKILWDMHSTSQSF